MRKWWNTALKPVTLSKMKQTKAGEQLSFSVEQSGKFKVNYLYDVMNEKDGGQFVRELIWARDTFGYAPKEGTPAKEVLDRYRKA